MRIIVKPGVVLGEINIRLFHICITVSSVFDEYGEVAVLTSGAEGKHYGGVKPSLHPKFLAWDFRLWILKEEDRKPAVDKIREMLNAKNADYDVILEEKIIKDANGKEVKTVWMHIEFDPKPKEV